MRLVRQGLVFIFILYLSLVYMVGCARFHYIQFLNEPCIIPFKGYNYKTCKNIKVKIDEKPYVIPKDFKTNLASIPKILWPIFSPQYTAFVAPAILHDYLYHCHEGTTREFADEVLYSALIQQNVNAFTASKFYLAVRLFGNSYYTDGECS